VARRKVEGLLAAGAEVVVVAPEVDEMPDGALIERRAAQLTDLDGAVLAVCATDDPAINAALAREARRRGVLVNVVDDPDAGDFTAPAVLDLPLLELLHHARAAEARAQAEAVFALASASTH
jgi:siroheme synthase-like protein